MKPFEKSTMYTINVDDVDYLHELGYVVIPQPEVTYKLSSESEHDYALYLVGNDKWKHSSNITNKLLLSIVEALNLREVTEPKVKEYPFVVGTESPKKEDTSLYLTGSGMKTHFNIDPRIEPVPEQSGFACDYYRVGVTHPITETQVPYIAECGDIMESLNMTYAEANAFKAIWRTAAARTLGLEKSGNTSLRDAEKIKFFGHRHYLRESVNANNTDDRIVRKNK